ncbi:MULTISPECIES: TadE/TadG family type IV pilus assembly protein [unclassified Shinella]|uniref:TadE/TadG family type IV pilus assembly protein n=1 Tax=Shinella TaxID=323620 RepID=UPI00225D5A37|nr:MULTISPECIES: TadE/TadG family type IV pilus assembly protein [unclassified Shinella]CAI0340720.1 TadE-like protein [Rhizobiaceae bacterium]CAK7259071.1 Pilus assembly protein [Shinella sp. WSC3-e]MCO5137026.1 pilus assembly protein [Shinella sp.]MCW5706787.1 pilus assembly protein [Shinella sp.]MDC7253296.1 pilus assembly protein [Shinella sp. YE25]
MHALSRLSKDRAGTSALEFAIIAPLFFLILFTLIAYGIYLSVTHAVQQVAADAARTAVAGLNPTERVTLVNRYLDASHFDYAFLNRAKMQVVVTDDPANPEQFTVTITYDSGDLPIWNLFTFALPSQRIERYSTVRVGGL